ncbi:hypothetical protein BDW75DRAFT_245038 [Aspergillus navahoensis]
MAIGAEVLFNKLAQHYEDAYANSPNLCATVDMVINLLPQKSTILDVGCGTGKPVSQMLAAAGHNVNGIDIAEKMIEIARKQVPGNFERADMRTYQPPQGPRTFDAVLAIYSLFQISSSETHAMAFKFAEWLKPGGILVLGVTPSTSLPPGVGEWDATWDCVLYTDKPWMTETTDEIFLSEGGWRGLLKAAGLSVECERFFTFHPDDPIHQVPEDHLLLIARRTCEYPLLGPYPLPDSRPGPFHLNAGAWRALSGLVCSANLVGTVGAFVGGGRTLEISSGYGGLRVSTPKTLSTVYQLELSTRNSMGKKIEYPNNHFETVIGAWILDHVESLTQTLQEMVRVIDQSAPRPRLMLLQGAPWNEIIRFQTAICTPLAGKPQPPSHQGYLLDEAIKVFSSLGFGRVTMKQVDMPCTFPEEDMTERCGRAADMLSDMWYHDDAQKRQMKEALIPQLRLHFEKKPHEIGFDMVLLVAEPGL